MFVILVCLSIVLITLLKNAPHKQTKSAKQLDKPGTKLLQVLSQQNFCKDAGRKSSEEIKGKKYYVALLFYIGVGVKCFPLVFTWRIVLKNISSFCKKHTSKSNLQAI